MEAVSQITNYVMPVVAVLLAALASVLVVKLPAFTRKGLEWMDSKIELVKHEYMRSVLNGLRVLVGEQVLEFENTLVEGLKEKAADGKLTIEELNELQRGMRSEAVRQIRETATAQNLWDAAKKVFNSEGALVAWLFKAVETHVSTLPPSGLQTTSDGSPSAMEIGATVKKAEAPAVP